MPSGKSEEEQYRSLGYLAQEQPQEIRERRTAAEQTLGLIKSRMGAPGTYDLPGATTGVSGQPGVPPTSIFTTKTVEGAKKAKKRRKGRSVAAAQKVTKLDPEAAAEAALGSTQGRIVSRQLAEAEQLMAREGPLYDELIKNTQLPIIEESYG
ncbi:MAG: hypothetical protein ACXABY_03200 [Candidatus Thorarchaeota archaeon]|jgi:hypothetical protein